MPLLAELSNCLSAYNETVERILQSVVNACDVNQKRHDSPIVLHVQDLLSIDSELKRHLQRMEQWTERQKKIDSLEKTLESLSKRVHSFAKTLSNSQSSIQGCLNTATKVQRSVMNQERRTIDDLLSTARNLSKTTSGAPKENQKDVWMPGFSDWRNSTILKDNSEESIPTVPVPITQNVQNSEKKNR